MFKLAADIADDFWRDIVRRCDPEDWLTRNWLQRYRLPRRVARILVQNHGIRAVEKFTRGILEVRGRGIEHAEVQIRTEEFQNAIRFDDHVPRRCQALAQGGHGFRQTALFRASPENLHCSRCKKPRTVGPAAAVPLFADCPGVVPRGTVARLSLCRTDAVAILGDLHRGPLPISKSRNQARDHTGLAYIARMTSNHHQSHN